MSETVVTNKTLVGANAPRQEVNFSTRVDKVGESAIFWRRIRIAFAV